MYGSFVLWQSATQRRQKRLLAALGDATFGDNSTQFSAAFGRGLLGRMMKDEAKARAAFARDPCRTGEDRAGAARIMVRHFVFLRLIDAGLGRKEEALRESRRAVELVPLEKDSINGADMIQYSAIVAAWVGEKDLALQNLAKAAQLPGFLSYGRLKLLPGMIRSAAIRASRKSSPRSRRSCRGSRVGCRSAHLQAARPPPQRQIVARSGAERMM